MVSPPQGNIACSDRVRIRHEEVQILAEPDGNEPPSAASSATSSESIAKGAVTETRTFRDGLIYLYKRADYAKPTWLCRVKVPKGKGYVNRSTGTGDEHQAFKFADDLYNELLVKSLTGVSVATKRIGPVLDAYVRRLEPEKDRRSVHYKVLLMARVKPTVDHKTFDDLSTTLLSKVIDDQIAMTRRGHSLRTRSNESTGM